MRVRTTASTTSTIFVVRQISEKSIEYNKHANMCFVDLPKALDRMNLEDMLNVLEEKNTPMQQTADQ